ncbi:MAG: DUF169 domain-containing protein [Coriobacteriales bacterium]|jgi:uncharacterized protein (DUF169 family)/NAD-dependent dihydropyrimidine dehydrogenase PreA subunit|nr:DUF169 domain-containing protein [Coriobacteriales bacterium]
MIDQRASSAEQTPQTVAYRIEIDHAACTGCGLCVAFCPVDVFEQAPGALNADQHPCCAAERPGIPLVAAPELCWGCETCAGQCPAQAIRVINEGGCDPFAARSVALPLPAQKVELYREWSATLRRVLGLRWSPVAISLIPAGDPLPAVPVPSERLRYCQSLMAARRGRCIMLPANRHACPDGTSILGLTEMPAKLASGELYLLFHKLDSIEAAQRMVHERPHLEPRSIDATVVTPLEQAATEPQVIAVIAQPEQIMWLCMSASYYTGHRFDFHASGYNAQCVETTLIPYLSGELNISFGCYGCRASSDVGDELMFMGIPTDLMPTIIKGLRELDKKAIPQSRNKIYLPPLA